MENPIRQYRKVWELTMKRMAEKVGLSEASISRLESGKQAMTIELAEKLEEKTGIPAPVWAFPGQVEYDMEGGEQDGQL